MKYFTIQELTRSDTATKKGIDNTPSPDIVEHLTELVDTILDPIRERWGSGIKITSGYRCKALNDAVKGSKTSSHMSGYAADIKPSNGKMEAFYKMVQDFIKNVPYDQLINEYPNSKNIPSWVHISVRNKDRQQRRMQLTIR